MFIKHTMNLLRSGEDGIDLLLPASLLCLNFLLLFSHSFMSYSLWPCGLQHARIPCPSTVSLNLLKLMVMLSMIPSNHLVLCHPLLSPSPHAFNLSQQQDLFQWVSSSHQVVKVHQYKVQSTVQSTSASASVFAVNIQDWFPLWLSSLISLQSKGL